MNELTSKSDCSSLQNTRMTPTNQSPPPSKCTLIASFVLENIPHLLFAGLATTSVVLLLGAGPVGWVALAVTASAIGTFVLSHALEANARGLKTSSLSSTLKSIKQLIEFKISALMRLSEDSEIFNEVCGDLTTRGKIFLSTLPNKNDPRFLNLFKNKNIEKVISVNERWETRALSPSTPFSRKEYTRMGIALSYHERTEHKLLTVEKYDKIADDIKTSVKKGENLLIHDRGGMDCSAQGVAAYLIKHHDMTAEQAITTIGKKLGNSDEKRGLQAFEAHCDNKVPFAIIF